MDELSGKEYVIIDHFMRPPLTDSIRGFFNSHLDSFSKAGVGALQQNIIRNDIRGDLTYWLDRKRDQVLEAFWDLLDEMIHIFNRYCYLGISGYEFHLAKYPKGGHYEKHIDQFNNRSNRTISVIFYLNEDWQKGDGGELEIFRKDGSSILVEPIMGRCVMFMSAEVPHSVLTAHKDRYSLTGWLLQQPASLGQFFG